MGKCTDVFPYVWFLKSDSSNDVSHAQLMGGALCIHPTGILVSVTHAVKPDSPFFNDAQSVVTFAARRHTDATGVRVVEMIENTEGKEYGLSLFKLHKINQDEVFDAFPLPDSIAFKAGVKIFAFVHHLFPFSGAFGYVCQTYKSNACLSVPVPGGSRTVGSVVSQTHMKRICDCMSCDSRVSDVIEKEVFYESLRKLNPDLRLIQVQNLLHTTLDGQCGWPVFTEKTNRLVGLIAFSTGFFQFLIPAQILREVLDRNLVILGLDEASPPQSEVAQ
ncbi:uncharacterized protein LOC141612508 [Silene latifolia]|uniref:uncharacterized protein LOC141612508 n=1 Tax=Silene latifolia TaxID=37657 RepID=UPI003D779452